MEGRVGLGAIPAALSCRGSQSGGLELTELCSSQISSNTSCFFSRKLVFSARACSARSYLQTKPWFSKLQTNPWFSKLQTKPWFTVANKTMGHSCKLNHGSKLQTKPWFTIPSSEWDKHKVKYQCVCPNPKNCPPICTLSLTIVLSPLLAPQGCASNQCCNPSDCIAYPS